MLGSGYTGSWVLVVGCWLLGNGCWGMGDGDWVLGNGEWVVGAGYRMMRGGNWGLGRHWDTGTGYLGTGTGQRVLR